jgi:hypothetical protein
MLHHTPVKGTFLANDTNHCVPHLCLLNKRSCPAVAGSSNSVLRNQSLHMLSILKTKRAGQDGVAVASPTARATFAPGADTAEQEMPENVAA